MAGFELLLRGQLRRLLGRSLGLLVELDAERIKDRLPLGEVLLDARDLLLEPLDRHLLLRVVAKEGFKD